MKSIKSRPGRVEPINERKEPYMIRMTRETAMMLDKYKNDNCFDGRGDAIRALLDERKGIKIENRCKKNKGLILS